MSGKEDHYKAFAERAIEDIYKREDLADVYSLLCAKEKRLSEWGKDAFGLEYLCLRLALGCVAWVSGCRESGVTEKSVQGLFLKCVMDSFESPDTLPIASAFSEYLYARDGMGKIDETFPLVEKFLIRLTRQASPESRAVLERNSLLAKAVMEICESIRMSFEDDFADVSDSWWEKG